MCLGQAPDRACAQGRQPQPGGGARRAPLVIGRAGGRASGLSSARRARPPPGKTAPRRSLPGPEGGALPPPPPPPPPRSFAGCLLVPPPGGVPRREEREPRLRPPARPPPGSRSLPAFSSDVAAPEAAGPARSLPASPSQAFCGHRWAVCAAAGAPGIDAGLRSPPGRRLAPDFAVPAPASGFARFGQT